MKLTQKQILVLKKTQEQVNNLKEKTHQSVLHQFFIKKSSAATKENTCQDPRSVASSSTHEEVWIVKQQAIRAEIIATLQFASQNIPLSAAESLAMCYQHQFPDSIIAKRVWQ